MPNESNDITPAPIQHPVRRKAMEAGATLTTALTMGGILASPIMAGERLKDPKPTPVETQTQDDLERASEIAARLIGVSKEQLSARGLRKVENLPGYEMKVGPEIRRKLAGSTLRMVYKLKGSEDPWRENCTATKIAWNGQPYLISAAHCFNTIGVDFSNSDGWPAQNIIEAPSNDYAATVNNMQFPIGNVEGISVMAPGGDDYALIKISQQKGPSPVNFDTIPALNYDKPQKAPTPGEQVALFSNPVINKLPVMATGRYLGRIWHNGPGGRKQYDIVGIDPNEPKDDACNFGASGSSAITASGFITGPLSLRNSVGYKSGIPNPNATESPLAGVKSRIRDLERELGIRLEKFATICYYTVRKRNPQNSQKDSIASLVKGLEHKPPIYPMK